jgi:hypothetical protein
LQLRELQARFVDAITGGVTVERPPMVDSGLLAVVRADERLGATERLAIYADMYASRLVDVLREDYPCVAAVLGEERFTTLARSYLAAHPSTHPSVRHVGQHLARFLDATPATHAPAYLADLARLEWLRGEAFDAPEARPLELERLKAVPADQWPDLRLRLIPAFRTLTSSWPVHEVWAAANAGEPPGPVAATATAIRIWRESFTVYHAVMTAIEARALARLAAGEAFGAACEEISSLMDPDSAPREAGSLLLRWIEDGILAELPEPRTP